MSKELQEIALSYFKSWESKNFEAIHKLMHDNVTYIGPLAKCKNVEECMQGLKGIASITSNIVIKHMWSDDHDVITCFELYTTKTAEPLYVCNWMNNKINSIRVIFDPRSILNMN